MPGKVFGFQIKQGAIRLSHIPSELGRALILSGPGFPVNPQEGQLWFNTTDSTVYIYLSGKGWVKLDSIEGGLAGDVSSISGIMMRRNNHILEWSLDGIEWHSIGPVVEKVKYFLVNSRTQRLDAAHEYLNRPGDGSQWFCLTQGATWTARNGHTSVVTSDGKVWVIGGYDGLYKNDVWYSLDGSVWTQATSVAGWTARYGHSSVVTNDGRIWVIGGRTANTFVNDVWYSFDGSAWTQATSNGGWSIRSNHGSVVTSSGRILVIGGYYYNNNPYYRNDVWYSPDGQQWTQLTSAPGWSARGMHAAIVGPDGRIWILGGNDGYTTRDVWYSSNDGYSWLQATSSPGWFARQDHTSVFTSDGRMWVIGGSSGGSYYGDVSYSLDGSFWTQATSGAQWGRRSAHTSVVFNNKILLTGGFSGLRFNDVWYTDLTTSCSTHKIRDFRSPQNKPLWAYRF